MVIRNESICTNGKVIRPRMHLKTFVKLRKLKHRRQRELAIELPKGLVEKTSIGPHLTLILKAGGILDIKEELEAGYRSEKGLTLEEQLPYPKKSRTKQEKGSLATQTTIRLTQPRPKETTTGLAPQPVTPVYSIVAQPIATSSELPRKVILETSEM